MSTFQVRVNDGPEQTIEVKATLYHHAAAAVPAILGIRDCPIVVEIWSADLVPEYGPYFYRIEEDHYGNMVVRHVVRLKSSET